MQKPPDVNEIQMAVLIANVRNAASAKAKSKPDDYMITPKRQKRSTKATTTDDVLRIGKYNPIKKDDLSNFLKSPSQK